MYSVSKLHTLQFPLEVHTPLKILLASTNRMTKVYGQYRMAMV